MARINLDIEGDFDPPSDVEIGERYESIDIGPFTQLFSAYVPNPTYLRLRAHDLVVVADQLHQLADRIIDDVLDARHEKMELDKVECPGCRTRIFRDETSCGSSRCERIAAQETAL